MGSRLFLKIYLTVLASIAVLAITGFAAVMLLLRPDVNAEPFSSFVSVLAAAVPETGDAAVLQATLDRLGAATGAGLTVVDARRTVLAHFEPSPPLVSDLDPVTVQLPQGRILLVQQVTPFGPPRGNPLILLLIVSSVTALVAWPVVRHLTRRLEVLRRSVEGWGEGNLSTRAPVLGRDEIAIVARSFNQAAERVEGLITSNQALLANASHELRSPLARLRMGVELFEADPSAERRDEIYRNLNELDDLVGEILLSSRLNHSGAVEPPQRIDLLAIAAEEASRFDLEARGRSVEVLGDARLLHRMVRNLIQNAQRHGRPPIEITVEKDVAHATLSVRDHGKGIDHADLERVFEPFYRPGGHGESAGGWGLGLALVRQIAERHGGVVLVESPVDGGARFVVMLPHLEGGTTDIECSSAPPPGAVAPS